MFKKIKIFISYRRNTQAGYAGRLYEILHEQFNVFFDTDTIEYGEPFEKRIEQEVKSSNILLFLLDQESINEFQNKKSNEKDYVRFELEIAYTHNLHIIPILLNNAQMPHANDLPKSLSFLPRLNAFSIRHDSFKRDVNALILSISNRYGNRFLNIIKKHFIMIVITILILSLSIKNIIIGDGNILGKGNFQIVKEK